ncbi:MAG: NfeD family protein [Chlorobiales bacterium]|nr:NfeD family protein [Chlorobiales bacterium]
MQLLSDWHFWIIGGIILLILEIFTPGFVIGIFGFACFAGAVAAVLGLGLASQIVSFGITIAILFLGVRPFVIKHLYNRDSGHQTNVSALIGQTGFVTEKIDRSANTGRIKIGGEEWRAATGNELTIEAGQKVVIRKVEGVTLFVEPILD